MRESPQTNMNLLRNTEPRHYDIKGPKLALDEQMSITIYTLYTVYALHYGITLSPISISFLWFSDYFVAAVMSLVSYFGQMVFKIVVHIQYILPSYYSF